MSNKKPSKSKRFFNECREYELPLRQCPQFLFFIMGLLICFMAGASYLIGTRYLADPAVVALMVLVFTGFLFVIDVLIVKSFERIAEANKMKSEFVAVVSHQLRSPLSNFRWALEALKSGKIGEIEESQLEYVNILKENTERMLSLVSDLLMVSRIQTSDLPLEEKRFSLAERVTQTVKRYKPLSEAANVKIITDLEDVPEVEADPKKIDLVVENLLDNAIRYTKGGGDIVIRLKSKGDKVKLKIEDEGIGIPAKDQKHIFEKFFRARNATRKKTEGSGLGLYIARFIIEQSGGRVGFESEEGRGTTFFFTLPTHS